jgi:hypothetical protein
MEPQSVTVKMTKTREGSPDGIAVQRYEAGKTYDLPAALATVFVAEDWGKIVPPKKEGGGNNTKMADGPTENK